MQRQAVSVPVGNLLPIFRIALNYKSGNILSRYHFTAATGHVRPREGPLRRDDAV